MPRNKFGHFVTIGAVAALLSGAALAEPFGQETLLGSPAAADGPVNKVVKIDADTRWVNVTHNDIVKFIVRSGSGAEQSFAWHFDTSAFAVDLNKIAQAGVIGHPLYVYIAPDPYTDSMD